MASARRKPKKSPSAWASAAIVRCWGLHPEKQVYCVFDGKLARIIQEQGRRDQLGVKFGSGDSPNCRGITVPELQSIDFDKINFSDFYEDLMKNQKIPDTSTQVKQIKDRIAAQVNQQGGGK
jgi:conjugal transfer mating pair stabilization protein TraN